MRKVSRTSARYEVHLGGILGRMGTAFLLLEIAHARRLILHVSGIFDTPYLFVGKTGALNKRSLGDRALWRGQVSEVDTPVSPNRLHCGAYRGRGLIVARYLPSRIIDPRGILRTSRYRRA